MELQYVAKALTHDKMLTVSDFIKAVDYPIDAFALDRFWATMHNGRLIYVDDGLIRWMGYANTTVARRRNDFMNLIKGSDYKYMDNAEYDAFCKQALTILPNGASSSGTLETVITVHSIYPPKPTGIGVGTTKHLLLSPVCLKKAMMRVDTCKGDAVRDYYIALEDLFQQYVRYQTEFSQREASMWKQLARELCEKRGLNLKSRK